MPVGDHVQAQAHRPLDARLDEFAGTARVLVLIAQAPDIAEAHRYEINRFPRLLQFSNGYKRGGKQVAPLSSRDRRGHALHRLYRCSEGRADLFRGLGGHRQRAIWTHRGGSAGIGFINGSGEFRQVNALHLGALRELSCDTRAFCKLASEAMSPCTRISSASAPAPTTPRVCR